MMPCRVLKRQRVVTTEGCERRSKRKTHAVQRLIPLMDGQGHDLGQSHSVPLFFVDYVEVGEIIGEGTFGSVRLCSNKTKSQLFAMKYIKPRVLGESYALGDIK
jgi:hypothetical protein